MKNFRTFFTILMTVVLVSCGEEKKAEEKITIGQEGTLKEVDETTGNEEAESVVGEDGVVEVVLQANDQMQFSKNEIKVKAGQKVRLVLKHVGQLNENVMGHNFVLLKQGTDLVDFAQKAASAKENNYIPEGTDKVIAHTEMIGGGEETVIEFEAPEKGVYDFICSFPGHYVQMQGKFIVE